MTARRIPTAPGWWLYGSPDDPSFAEVCEKDGVLVGLFCNRDRMVADPACRWLAPIPSPDVCRALADYAAALAAWDAEQKEADAAHSFEGPSTARLDNALRAERGEAE